MSSFKYSPLKSVAELKYRKVALNQGSNVYYLLARALEKAGLAYTDIQTVFLPPADARAAFERGSVDAWAIWDPFWAAAEKTLKPRILATSRGLSGNYTFYLANRSYAEKHGSTLQLLFEELTKSDHLVKSKQQEAVRIVAESNGLDREIVDVYLSCRPRSPVVHLMEGSEVVALVKASEVSLAKL